MYLARDLELGMLRAVKELPLTSRREARLLRLLEHPALPQMIDYTERGGYCYIVMEYIPGRSFEQYLKEGYMFSLEEILETADVILQVLEYLHSRRPAVYYGDLKPANLMMTEHKRIYMVDFGSAVFSYSASYKETKGTRGYAAPEQLEGKITVASDLYALGRTLETLCGKRKLQYYICCPELGRFIFKCCRMAPEKRWQSAGEARRELQKIHPVKLKLKSLLIPAAAASLALATALSFGFAYRSRSKLPDLSKILTSVTSEYYSAGYRIGTDQRREKIYEHIEERLQKILKVYQSSEEQSRIMEMMAFNGELSGRADRAELYYRQLLTYEPEYSEGYLEYGMFLCRQNRYQESRAVYRQWESVLKQTEKQKTEDVTEAWKIWEREAGIILGRKNESFLS